ncbi:hypothetical protein MYD03_00625, partial [Mediterraneibacter gnavus]
PIIGNLNESIAHQEAVRDKLNEAAAKITETASDAGNYQVQLDQLVQQVLSNLGIRSDYENNVKTQINTMFGTLGDTSSAVQSCSPVWTMESKIWKNWRRMQDPVWRR